MDAPLTPKSEKRKVKLPVFTFAELISATLRLYGENFGRFVLPLALVVVPSVVLSVGVSESALQNSRLQTFAATPGMTQAELQRQVSQYLNELVPVLLALVVVGVVVAIFQSVIIGSIISWLTSESYLGRAGTTGEAFRVATQRAFPLIGGFLAYFAWIFLISIAMTFVLFLCGLGFGILAYISLALGGLLVPVFVLERVGMGRGLRRSWHLGKRRFWMLFGVTAVTSVFAYIASLVIAPFTGNSPVVSVIAQSVLNILVIPFGTIASTLIYYDARVRYEDLEGALATAPTPTPSPADVESPVYHQVPLFEGSDFTNLAIMTALLFVLILVLGGLSIAGGGGMSAIR
jgi:hypothetical protein